MSTNKGESLAYCRALGRWPAEGDGPSGVGGGKCIALLDAATIDLIDRAYMGALYTLRSSHHPMWGPARDRFVST
ncbi:hypothetical protein [Lichenifustis flavocetrariae]|uniref:Uncharacterized protein n=1 Tax=Lichenifustis flavocetrariae TaxID=2949735 RepID=A0AA41Z3L0_9HYPH|nr:hypothetical protein [Lichenifustis flavocetrariae]MCW6513089.1 hypothetical protein [Lichenifustis flavocetrariae]